VCAGEQEMEGLAESDGVEMARASPLMARLAGTTNPGSQGQLSRSDAYSFSYSLAPSTKGRE